MKNVEMKEKIKKEYIGRTIKQLETKLNSRKLIKDKKIIRLSPSKETRDHS